MQWPVHAWALAHTPIVATRRAANASHCRSIAPIVDPTSAPARVPHRTRPPRKGAATITGDADFTRDAHDAHDTIQLRDGTISVDARDRAPVAVAIGDTTIQVTNAHVEIRAAHGVIVSAHAFAGSVERTSPESTAIISAGEVWTPPPPEASLAAFRVGWRRCTRAATPTRSPRSSARAIR